MVGECYHIMMTSPFCLLIICMCKSTPGDCREGEEDNKTRNSCRNMWCRICHRADADRTCRAQSESHLPRSFRIGNTPEYLAAESGVHR
jgi:hypothetical protein